MLSAIVCVLVCDLSGVIVYLVTITEVVETIDGVLVLTLVATLSPPPLMFSHNKSQDNDRNQQQYENCCCNDNSHAC